MLNKQLAESVLANTIFHYCLKPKQMDFLTLLPYIGILVLVAVNALLVLRRHIKVDDNDHNPDS